MVEASKLDEVTALRDKILKEMELAKEGFELMNYSVLVIEFGSKEKFMEQPELQTSQRFQEQIKTQTTMNKLIEDLKSLVISNDAMIDAQIAITRIRRDFLQLFGIDYVEEDIEVRLQDALKNSIEKREHFKQQALLYKQQNLTKNALSAMRNYKWYQSQQENYSKALEAFKQGIPIDPECFNQKQQPED